MRRRQRSVEVDITPLIDILFMLIIFFVLASSFVQGRLRVELPKGEGDPGRPEALMISMKEDGGLLWGDDPITSADLFLRLEGISSGDELLLAADRGVPYGHVAELLDGMRRAGAERVGLALQGGAPR